MVQNQICKLNIVNKALATAGAFIIYKFFRKRGKLMDEIKKKKPYDENYSYQSVLFYT